VTFTHTDIAQFSSDTLFDAVVGRYILQFLPDPVGILRSLSQAVRPGGLIQEASARSGVNLEMGPELHGVFQDAGLPVPRMRLEMELGHDPDFTRWVSDVVRTLHPQIEKFHLPLEQLGDLDTLGQRLQEEVAASKTVVPWIGLVGAWCRKATE
jgi:hypothetical protein